jgi:hypothetical protein
MPPDAEGTVILLDDVQLSAAQLATATASVQQLRVDVELATAQRDAEAERVTRELAVLRAQQAPLVACVDALRAAATAAGWRDADATGETLVAWVRRGEREACAWIADDTADESDGCHGEPATARSIATKIRGREGGE